MAIATWWRGDGEPALPNVPGFTTTRSDDVTLIAELNALDHDEVRRRFAEGHHVYVGTLDRTPATYGWVATADVSLGELGLSFSLESRDRYLWDFGTLPSFRGLGLYPRLLDELRRHEAAHAERLWIIYAPENQPSGVGIGRAGFQTVADLAFTSDGGVALRPVGSSERGPAAAALLGLPVTGSPLTSCWRCESAGVCGCRPEDEGCSCHVAPGWPSTARV